MVWRHTPRIPVMQERRVRMKNRVFLALVLAAVLSFGAMVPAMAEDTIKIGGLAPLTGSVAQYGIAVKEGADLYISQLNAAGGIGGKKVEILWEDEKGDVTEAINAYNKLVYQDGVVAILGDVTSKPTLAVGDLAVTDGIPMITASSTAYDVTTDKPNVFRSCFLDPFQAETMANFAKDEFGATKLAVLYDIGDDYSTGLAEAFKAQAEKNGQEIVAYESGAGADVDFKSQLTKIKDAAPEVLFVAEYLQPAALVIKQASDIGLDVKFLGADGIGGIESLMDKADLALLEKMFYSDHFAADATSEAVVKFNADFAAAYGKAPYSAFNATAYDAAMILCEAIKAAGSTEAEAVVAAMKATAVDGVTGHITFDDHNDPTKNAFITTFKDGAKVFFKVQEP